MAVILVARPSFRSRYDKVAFAINAAFLSAGYTLNCTGAAAFSDDVLYTSSSADEVGIDNWNEIEDNYAFVYFHPDESSKKVLVKCLVMNDKLLVDALREGDSQTVHLEVNVGDYVKDNAGENYGSQFKNLENLVADVNEQLLGQLDGSLAASSSGQQSSSQTISRDDSDRPGDLLPGPGAGIYPTRGHCRGISMLIAPRDPRFPGGRSGQPGLPVGQLGVPPGSRSYPYRSPGLPGSRLRGFARSPLRPREGTHPDLHRFS